MTHKVIENQLYKLYSLGQLFNYLKCNQHIHLDNNNDNYTIQFTASELKCFSKSLAFWY